MIQEVPGATATEDEEESRRASELWEGGAPPWITIPQTQMRPNVLMVWLYLYMVDLTFGDGVLGVLSE